ncbi:MAG: hypothetical protein WB710_01135 [Stellaceae bacterium]|jgi:hypothetical protein
MPHGDHAGKDLPCPQGCRRARLTSIDNRLSIIETRLADLENGLTQFRAEVNARFSDVGSRFSDVGSRFTMLTWAVGINAAATIAILGVLLKGH